ncbi:MAG: MFS transporter [Rhodospirillaceae bacterium]
MIAAIERMTGLKWRAQGPAFLVGAGHGATHWILATIYVILPFVRDDLGLSYTEAGSVITVFHAASFSANVGSGAVVDMTGRRVLTQVASLIVGGLALAFVGFAVGIWALAGLVVFIGLTNNLWHPAAIAYLSKAYPDNRGYALSIHTLGASVGDTLAPLAAGALLLWLSWQGAASANALPVFAVALALYLMLGRDEKASHKAAGAASSGMGLGAYFAGLAGLFKDRAVVGLCVMAGFRSMCQNGLLVYVPMLLKDVFGFGPVLLGLALTTLQVGGMISGPVAGTVSDRAGRRPVVLGGLAATTGVVLVVTVLEQPALLIGLMAILGGVLFAVRPVIHGWAMDMTPDRMHGSAVSLLFGTQSAFSMIVPIMGGVIADTWGVVAVFYALAATMAVATLITVTLPDRRR